jgi:BirA family transcriptional regulator, biotin operon repressor / biotin---[acetyl-CoA-carboxylase] ligase
MEPESGSEWAAPEEFADRVSARLRTARFGRPLHVHATAASTNDLARGLADTGASEGTAVLALEQMAGRGRLGRRWASPPGGLYVSLVLRPRFPIKRWPLIGLACALGAAAAAEAHVRRGSGAMDASLRVKWPNDLLLDGRKVGGILVEAAGGAAICGIGLNVVPPTRSGPSWIGSQGSVDNVRAAGAAWLAARNPDVSLLALVADVLLECERKYAVLGAHPAEILAEWRARTVTLGRMVHVDGPEPFDGVAEDIDAGGALLVRTPLGIRRVRAGDVVVYEPTHG